MSRSQILTHLKNNQYGLAYEIVYGIGWARGLTTLPPYLIPGMVRYILVGIGPGDFLTAFLSNDLMGAMVRADDMNKDNFYSIARFLHNYAPGGCFGSSENVTAWLALGGVIQKETTA